MRFAKLTVRNFQAIEAAEVELGQGLNVLYGPNDLGKSTLASAIRAVLLVPASSSEAARYKRWFADTVPEVSLTFVDDDNHFWRVRKAFASSGTQSAAELYHSKDGLTFTRDCDARKVDERLRETLGWGIPSPGGKGAPKKLPTSFLAHVLLAEQSEVETILEQSTEEDGTASGRDRLRKVLSALAEDPWFKKVLIMAQGEVDALFTPTGQRKRGRGSRFAIAAEDVKRRAERIEILKKAVAESSATEEHVSRVQEQCASAREATENASMALIKVRQLVARAIERSRVAERLAEGQEARAALERQRSDIDDRTRVIGELEIGVGIAERNLGDAQTEREWADAAVRGAEDALRAATSEDGFRDRELARAKLAEERAEVGERLGRAETRHADLERAKKTIEAAESAATTSAEAQRTVERAAEAVEANDRERREAEAELSYARSVLDYGQWHAADTAARGANELRVAAEASRREADAKRALAEGREDLATRVESDATARRGRLPDATFAARIADLQQQIAVVEAALGGGFSIALRGTGKVPVHLALDGRDAVAGTAVDCRLVLEAERAATLRVGDLLDVEIVAGAAEKRRALEALRQRWANEAEPVLSRAGVATADELRIAIGEVTELMGKAETARGDARQLRTEAEAGRDSAAMKSQRVEELLVHAREAETLEAKLGTLDRSSLAAAFAKLGGSWKRECEVLVDSKEKKLRLALEKMEKATRTRDLDAYRASEAAKLAAATAAEAQRLRVSLVGELGVEVAAAVGTLDRALVDVGSELEILNSRRGAIDEELRIVTHAGTTAIDAARVAVAEAKARQERAIDRVNGATREFASARSCLDTARGEVEVLRKVLAAVDQAAVESRVVRTQAELDLYAGDPPLADNELAAAEAREARARDALDGIRAELNQGEGALSKVGGMSVREELSREEEAYALAREGQRELELDADAWKLLRETLDIVEKESTIHLGRSLAAPVSARIVELTKGRYEALRLDQHLRAESVAVPLVATEADVLQALSVGTRNQIATLLRVTIAEQLKSAIVLDDHLVHTDPDRLAWFRDLLRKAALTTQVVVLTCRPQDYVAPGECPDLTPLRDVAGGMLRTIDVGRLVRRWEPSRSTTVSGATGDAARERPSR